MFSVKIFFMPLQDVTFNFTSLTNSNKFSFSQLVDLLDFTKMPKKITNRELISNESNLFNFFIAEFPIT